MHYNNYNNQFLENLNSIDYTNEMDFLGFNVEKVSNSSELCKKSNLIVTTTNANESLINRKDIQKGTHITAIGSDTPEKRELDPEILNIADSAASKISSTS